RLCPLIRSSPPTPSPCYLTVSYDSVTMPSCTNHAGPSMSSPSGSTPPWPSTTPARPAAGSAPSPTGAPPAPPGGGVRPAPGRRPIRWSTTIGLIDRPVAHRGRTALYGPRHLLQLVAVKRLQARGLPLVAIHQELAGATGSQLARVARLPLDTRPAVLPVPAVVVPDGGDRPTGRGGDGGGPAGPPCRA